MLQTRTASDCSAEVIYQQCMGTKVASAISCHDVRHEGSLEDGMEAARQRSQKPTLSSPFLIAPLPRSCRPSARLHQPPKTSHQQNSMAAMDCYNPEVCYVTIR